MLAKCWVARVDGWSLAECDLWFAKSWRQWIALIGFVDVEKMIALCVELSEKTVANIADEAKDAVEIVVMSADTRVAIVSIVVDEHIENTERIESEEETGSESEY